VQFDTLSLACGERACALHREYATLPESVLYLPATHAVHSWPSDPVYPALQMQFDTLSLACGEWACALYRVHATLPDSVLYLPATQAVHSWPSDPVYPALQVQFATLSLPTPRVRVERAIRARVGPQPRLVCTLRTQRARRVPLAPVLPATHWQSSCVVAPSPREFLPRGQSTQVRDAEMSGLYFARTQSAHVSSPVFALRTR